ncbi:MAG: glycosyltransferase family 2 protein [Limnochordia bacterium]
MQTAKRAVIIPAYNEEANLGHVLRSLADLEGCQVIVVNDGSTDGTSRIAQSWGVQVIDLPQNIGKGGAMRQGALHTDADILLFLDADLLGLTTEHVYSLLEPVARGEADMTIGLFDEGRLATDLAQKIAPFLSGQRAIRRELLLDIPQMEKSRYGVEVALSKYAENKGLKIKKVVLKDCSQVLKEEKQGVWKGFGARLKMYWEILKSLA